MTKKTKLCRRCEKNPAVVNYCTPCCKEVSRAMDNVMENTRGAVALAKSMPGLPESTKVGWFLGIFHPGMPASQVHAVIADVRRNER